MGARRERLAVVEARAGLAWKVLLFALEVAAAPLLAPRALASPLFLGAAALWLGHGLAFAAAVWRRPGTARSPAWAYSSFFLDLAVLSALVALAGQAGSLYAFLYPAHVLWLAVIRTDLREVVACGLLGFGAYNLARLAGVGLDALFAGPGRWIEMAFVAALVAGPLYRLRLLLRRYEEARAARRLAEESVSRLRRDNVLLQELSVTDPLTGLYNKRYFDVRLAEELGRAGLTGQPVALALLDVDRFKQYNDTYGHVRGDELLKTLAELLRQNCRSGDVLCRLGGEEFAIILPATGAEAAAAAAERIRRAVEQHPFPGSDPKSRVRVTVSLGIAVYPTDATDPTRLVECADQALYRAKDAGRNAVVLHSSLAACVGSGAELGADGEELLAVTGVIQTLLSLAQVKDRYTYGHAERTAQLAAAIAQRLGLDPVEIRRLRYAALAHDLGNAAISSHLLVKQGPLSEAERRVLQEHTLLGVSLIEPFGDLRDLIPIVASHHERWDGSGYPAGLRGEEIPLAARILAVADSYDAMRQHRPYRPALAAQEAAAQLVEGAGSRYDPRAVEALLEVLAASGQLDADAADRLLARLRAAG